MAIERIHHVAYRCKDAKQTVEWYRQHLGMEFVLAIAEDKVPSTHAPDPYMHVFLDAGNGNVLAFFELPNSPDMGRDAATPEWVQHLAFKVGSVAELEATKAKLEAAGIPVVGVTDHTIFKSIYFFDPNGHRLELACDTATRRFFPGARVVAVSFDRHRPTAASYGVVQEVEDGLLRLAGSGVSAVVGGRVYPLIDAEVSLEPGEITYEGSRAAMVRVRATEVAGPSALPGLSRLTGPNTYRGLPILVAPIDWREPPSMAVLRPGESFTSGLAQVVYPRGLRSRMAFTLHVLGISRAAIWPVLQLFDGRRGRTRRLWAINPGTLMDVLAVEVDAITVGVEALFANLAAVQAHVSYLGVVYADGTADVREIATVGTAASTTPGYAEDWRFQLLGRISTTKAVVRVGFAHLGRFEEDSIEEEWTTPTICRTSLPFLEEVRDA